MKRDQYISFEEVLSDRASDDFIERPLGSRIFRWFFLFTVFISTAVVLQLLNIGVYQHSFYSAKALANTVEAKPILAQRGIIMDRTGQPLVLNEPAYNVFIVPRELEGSLEENPTIVFLSEILGEDPDLFILAIENKRWRIGERLFVTNKLSQDNLVLLMGKDLAGLELKSGYRRTYPEPMPFAHILGYTGRVSVADLERDKRLRPEEEIGKKGLEAQYDGFLRGTNGEEVEFYDALGVIIDSYILREPERGKDIHTFIDKELQEFAYSRLERELKNLNRNAGLVIALDPRNGEVLSLVSFPSFDPGRVFDYLDAPFSPLFNRVISGAYSPGSVIKPLVGVAALYEGIIKPEETILSRGQIEIPNPYNPQNPMIFRDWRPHGWVDIYSAIARSSNVYFYEVGGGYGGRQGLGIRRLKDWWERFGLGSITGIDLPAEREGFLPDPEWKMEVRDDAWRLGDTYNVTIGQGDILLTPIALINYIAGIANGGEIYRPRIADFVKSSSDRENIVFQNEMELLYDLSEAKEVIEEIRKAMIETTRNPEGTARSLGALPMTIAAKTGTAQAGSRNITNAFIVAYAPAENPEIAILVVVENSVEGAPNTIPVARDILLWYYENRLASDNQ